MRTKNWTTNATTTSWEFLERRKKRFDDLIYLDGLFPQGLSYDETIRKLMKFVEDDPGSQEFIIRHGPVSNFGVIYRNQVGGSHHMNLCIDFDEERKIQAIDVCTSYGSLVVTPFRFPHPKTKNSNKALGENSEPLRDPESSTSTLAKENEKENQSKKL